MSGVQNEGTADAGGGGNLGYIDNGDWMDYNVNPSASGTYTVSFRVAAAYTGAQLQVRKFDGSVLATVNLPQTGGWQTWQTVTANVALSAGNQTLRVVSTSTNGWNFNYMDFAQGATAPAPIPTPTPTPTPTPSTAIALPGKVQSEAYTAMQGVQKEGTSDVGGGENVGYIDNGDWMEYNVNPATSGTYTVNLRVATPQSGGVAQIKKADGSVLATVNIPVTSGWQTFQTVSATLTLSSGAQNIRVVSAAASNWNINWVEFVSGATVPTTPTTPNNPTPSTGSSTKIEAESHIAQSGTSQENTQDAGGGQNVGWIDMNDWMEFSVNPSTSGTYTISFRVATEQNGGKVELRKTDGTVLATATVPNTGGWQTWQTVTATANLTAGAQNLRVVSAASPNWNINWWQFGSGSSTTTPTPTTPPPSGTVSLPGKVEAEAWSGMHGVQTENTNDAGGGQNVGYIDYLDWMDYSVQPTQSGSYNLQLRIATPNTNAQIQIKNAAGNTIGTVNLPSTGGYQTWQTINLNLTLQSGAQTIRLVSTGGGSFNINYLNFDIAGATVTAKAATDGTTDAIELSTTNLELYPNPVVSQVVVKVSNNLTGNISLEVLGTDGTVKKVQQLQKTATGTAQYYLSLSDLAPGSYILRATMTDFAKTVTFIKL